MSFELADDPKAHGIFLGIAIRLLLEASPDSQLIAIDDVTGTRLFDGVPQCPTIQGYRPDAIVVGPPGRILVECKSAEDLFSFRSQGQFIRVREIMAGDPNVLFYLFCFGLQGVDSTSIVAKLGFNGEFEARFQFVSTEEYMELEYECT